MRRPRYQPVDPSTTTNLAEGPLPTAVSCLRWDTPGYALANLLIVALTLAILAVWVVPVDAPPLRVMTRAAAGDGGGTDRPART